MKLDFLVIGGQKCASSWLYYCLKDHPDIQLPKSKREVEYVGGDLYQQHGIEWYKDLFGEEQQNKVVGDVSVNYLSDGSSPALVKKYFGYVKYIMLVRNPIERAVSAYYWYIRKGLIAEEISLDKAFELAIVDYHKHDSSSVYYDLINRSLYGKHMTSYLKEASYGQFLVVSFNSIQKEPLDSIQKIYSFVGANNTYEPKSLSKKPKKNSYLNWVIRLEQRFKKSKILSYSLDLFNQLLSNLNIKGEKKTINKKNKIALEEIFKQDHTTLKNLLASLNDEQLIGKEHLLYD